MPSKRTRVRASRIPRGKVRSCGKPITVPFPFVNGLDRSPQTPIRQTSALAARSNSAGQTHPLSSPFYSPPLIGLRFGKNFNGQGGISREGAFVTDEFSGYKYYEVKRVIVPSAGTIPGNTFVSINVGQPEEGGDVSIPSFDPVAVRSAWNLRLRMNGLREPTGVTIEELGHLCTHCVQCGNFIMQTSQVWHECPDDTNPAQATSSGNNDDSFFESVEYRLDAVGTSVGGVTKEEFEGAFARCLNCDRILTASGRERHGRAPNSNLCK